MEKIKIAVVKPCEIPVFVEIENCVESFREVVGGSVEISPLFGNEGLFICCNEEGKNMANGLQPNQPLCDADGNFTDYVCGTFLVFRSNDGKNAISLTNEDCEYIQTIFGEPKIFLTVKKNSKLFIFPIAKDCKRYRLPRKVEEYASVLTEKRFESSIPVLLAWL